MNMPETARPAHLHPKRTHPWEFRQGLAPCARALLALVLAALTVGAAAASAEPARAAVTNSDRIVVMISVDGLAGYYLDDPQAQMPTLRELAAAGARAASMKVSTPSVTWPNHTTLVTGVTPARHGVVGNNYFDRGTGQKVTLISDPVFDKEQIVKVPTIYDLAKAAGMKTAAIRWPATRNAPTLDWTIPAVSSPDLFRKYTTPALLSECEQAQKENPGSAGGADPSGLASGTPTDETCTRVFNFILHKHRPNLALLHVTDVDHTQHLKGPKSPEAYAAVKAADGQVREVWEELQRDFPGKATLLVVSDHGFSETKGILLPNVVLRKAGLVSASGKKSKSSAVQVVAQGGAALVYVLDQAHRASVLARVRQAFTGVKEVSKIIGPDQLKDYGVADPKDDPHAPDMLLFAQEGCVFGDTAAGQLPFSEKPERRGSHGHDPDLPDLHATFVAWGVGIKHGARLGEISNLSVAPTLAKLLGLSIPNAQGQPLAAALAN
jgi:predicted AlkP superfamily pyrophosphatase or phosphodiesterase